MNKLILFSCWTVPTVSACADELAACGAMSELTIGGATGVVAFDIDVDDEEADDDEPAMRMVEDDDDVAAGADGIENKLETVGVVDST